MHLRDEELLLELDGEFPGGAAHLAGCAACRGRQAALAQALDVGMEAYRGMTVPVVPARRNWYLAAAGVAASLAAVAIFWADTGRADSPRAALTPGAVRTSNAAAVCAVGGEDEAPEIGNREAMEVFRRYGITDPRPRVYEVDYLIPPDLGGADDPRNLWPQAYNTGRWNSRVKDALEERLRTMVCRGEMPLEEAQKEIAADWIGAYRRHFRTEAPLPDHVAFVKDRPWE